MTKWIVEPEHKNQIGSFAPFTIDTELKEHAEIIAHYMAPTEFKLIKQ